MVIKINHRALLSAEGLRAVAPILFVLFLFIVDAAFGTRTTVAAAICIGAGALALSKFSNLPLRWAIWRGDVNTVLAKRSHLGQYVRIATILPTDEEDAETNRIILFLDLGTRIRSEGTDVYRCLVARHDGEVLAETEVRIPRSGLVAIQFKLFGARADLDFNVLDGEPVYRSDYRAYEHASAALTTYRSELSLPLELKENVFAQTALGILLDHSNAVSANNLRRQIARSIHPDRGPADERQQRTDAMSWANAQIDLLEATNS